MVPPLAPSFQIGSHTNSWALAGQSPAPPADFHSRSDAANLWVLGVWRSLVARSVRVGEVPSSNLGTPILLLSSFRVEAGKPKPDSDPRVNQRKQTCGRRQPMNPPRHLIFNGDDNQRHDDRDPNRHVPGAPLVRGRPPPPPLRFRLMTRA